MRIGCPHGSSWHIKGEKSKEKASFFLRKMAVNVLNRDFWINKKYVLYIFLLPEKKKNSMIKATTKTCQATGIQL